MILLLAVIDEILRGTTIYILETGQKLPNGVYHATDKIDDDGVTDDPIHVEVEVTITDETVTINFTGSAEQTAGPINSPYPATVSDLRALFQAITLPEAETNEGFFDPLEVIAPEGTVFNPTKPAAIGTDWEGSAMAADLPWKALAPHIPEKLPAGHFMSVCATIVGGRDDRSGDDFLVIDPQPGGWGASRGQDGADVLVCIGDGDTLEMPVEVMESRFPLLFDEYRLNTPQECGHGKFRGGAGLVQDYTVYNESGAFLTASFGRHKCPPWGVAGGQDGNGNTIEIHENDGTVVRRGKVTTYDLEDGETARLITSSGGGYGDPFERDPDLVLDDYLDDYVTAEIAREVYGVVIDEETGTVDREATRRCRADRTAE